MAPTKRLFSDNMFLLALLLAGTFLVYQPGLYGDYVFDDLANITTNTALVITDFSSQSFLTREQMNVQARMAGTAEFF